MSRNNKSFGTYSIVIGILGVIALAIIVVAMKGSDFGQGMSDEDIRDYQAAVNDRIRPFGQVYLPGEEHAAAAPTVETAIEPEPVATVLTGPQVYNEACNVCHGNGVGGAPIVGDVAEWAPRIAQGIAVLNDHAVNGFTGEAATPMLPKGGRVDLSDQEIYDAVEYMVGESR